MIGRLLILASLILASAQGLYFYLEHGKPYCITEKQVDGKPIVFKYRNYDLFLYKPDYDDEDELNAQIYIISPLGTRFMELNAKDTGKVVFTPYESGFYTICVELTRPLPDEFWEYGNPLVDVKNEKRFYFDIQHGLQRPNMTKLAKIDDITEIDKTVHSLVKVLKEMTQEMEYQNSKEKEIRDEDDSDNRMILVWSLVEAVVMIVVAIIQVTSIRRVLVKKQVIQ